jgi:hypothetical protein
MSHTYVILQLVDWDDVEVQLRHNLQQQQQQCGKALG